MEERLPEILLLSHGEMCNGIVDSVKMLSGEEGCIKTLPLKVGQSMEDYLGQIRIIYGDMPEGSIILTDIMGGTPANCVVMLAKERDVYALAGISLATVLSAVYLRREQRGQELIDTIEQDTRDGIVNMGLLFSELKRG